MTDYNSLYQTAQAHPEKFWAKAAAAVSWYKQPEKILDDSNPPFYKWFSGATLNVCYNALDRHVEAGRGNRAALIFDSAMTGQQRTYSYSQLRDEVALFAGVLKSRGVNKGDRVLIYMPMVAEAAIAMLACARLGAVHSVVFGGFAAKELAVRIDDAQPIVIIAASCGLEPGRIVSYKPLIDQALELSNHPVSTCIILQRDQLKADLQADRDQDWQAVMAKAKPAGCVAVGAYDPLYILYTSGTTGQPKGVVRDSGGTVVSLQWSMKHIYGVSPGDVFWAASDVGWVVGHSYIVYGPLFNGNTTLVYEGKPVGTPDPGAFWRIVEQHQVSVLFTAPTALRAIRREDPNGDFMNRYKLSSLDALYLAGERCDPDTLFWAQEKLGLPVIDHWWQTETGWAICANLRGVELLPIVPGSPARPVPGYEVTVLDEQGQEVDSGESGSLVIKLPLPPGTFTTLWQNEERYCSAYFERFPGYYETGDAGYIDDNGYVFVMARTDDVINVAGHRLSTGAMEEVLTGHPAVAECAVIGIKDTLKGQVPLGLVVLNTQVTEQDETIVRECIQCVRDQIGPVAAFKQCLVVKRLPKTRSGKILRGTLRKIADGEPWTMPATIEDPAVLQEGGQVLPFAFWKNAQGKT